MARQASQFRQVLQPLTESTIRPVFQRPSFINGDVFTNNIGNGQTYDLRPPVGETWQLLFGSIVWATTGSGTIELRISLRDGSTNFIMSNNTTNGTVGQGPTIPGTNTFFLTNSRFIRFTCTASGGGSADIIGAIRRL